MVDEDIQAYLCDKEFGGPCRQSAGAMMFLIPLFLDIFHGTNSKSQPVRLFGSVYYWAFLAYCVANAIMIPYARFLLGVNSLD